MLSIDQQLTTAPRPAKENRTNGDEEKRRLTKVKRGAEGRRETKVGKGKEEKKEWKRKRWAGTQSKTRNIPISQNTMSAFETPILFYGLDSPLSRPVRPLFHLVLSCSVPFSFSHPFPLLTTPVHRLMRRTTRKTQSKLLRPIRAGPNIQRWGTATSQVEGHAQWQSGTVDGTINKKE